MLIIGCDYHPSWQQVCWMDTETGETEERKLEHASGEAEKFYRGLAESVLIGMESTGNCQWFVEMATSLGHEVWIGDAAKIRASDPRQQKHDRRDAALILKLLREGRFPRIWTPSSEGKDLRQLLIHRYKLVRIRAQVKNELQHLAMNQGVTKKRKLWSQAGEQVLRELPLRPWASRRREDLWKVKSMLDEQIAPLDQAVAEAALKDERARLLMTQPGVGPITSMAFVLTMGDVNRFPRGKQVASNLGLIPRDTVRAGSSGWARSASKETVLCGRCWWRWHRLRCAAISDFGSGTFGSPPTGRKKERPTGRRLGSWRFDSTGCCARIEDIQRSSCRLRAAR